MSLGAHNPVNSLLVYNLQSILFNSFVSGHNGMADLCISLKMESANTSVPVGFYHI